MEQPIISPSWKTSYLDACVGILAMHGVTNPADCPALDERKAALEKQLRARFQGQDRAAIRLTVYAPPRIDKAGVRAHLGDIQGSVRLIAPQVQVALLETYEAE